MKYLLDTDHITILQRPTGADALILSSRLDQHSSDDFGVSMVSFHEQVLGAHALLNRARRSDELIRGYSLLQEVLSLYAGAMVVPFGAPEFAVCTGLRKSKPQISTMDLRIAATAVSRNMILLTRNRADFAGIPGLVVEDWTA